MSELQFQFLGQPIFLMTGFAREVDSVEGWAMAATPAAVNLFNLVPGGPLLVETSTIPSQVTGGTLEILESPIPGDLGSWFESLTYPQYAQQIQALRTRTVTIPPGATFRQFINLEGPYAAINYTGPDWLNLSAVGLIPWAPSTMKLGPVALILGL